MTTARKYLPCAFGHKNRVEWLSAVFPQYSRALTIAMSSAWRCYPNSTNGMNWLLTLLEPYRCIRNDALDASMFFFLGKGTATVRLAIS